MSDRFCWARAAAAALPGLLAAAFTLFLASSMAAGGHGWIGPLPISLPLLLVYPLVLMRFVGRSGRSIWVDLALGALALAANAYLLNDTLGSEYEYFRRVLDTGTPYIWVAMWLLWQVLVGVTIAVRLKRRSAPGPFDKAPFPKTPGRSGARRSCDAAFGAELVARRQPAMLAARPCP